MRVAENGVGRGWDVRRFERRADGFAEAAAYRRRLEQGRLGSCETAWELISPLPSGWIADAAEDFRLRSAKVIAKCTYIYD
jgi:hypothetical protein